jgi:hypothetical protein
VGKNPHRGTRGSQGASESTYRRKIFQLYYNQTGAHSVQYPEQHQVPYAADAPKNHIMELEGAGGERGVDQSMIEQEK